MSMITRLQHYAAVSVVALGASLTASSFVAQSYAATVNVVPTDWIESADYVSGTNRPDLPDYMNVGADSELRISGPLGSPESERDFFNNALGLNLQFLGKIDGDKEPDTSGIYSSNSSSLLGPLAGSVDAGGSEADGVEIAFDISTGIGSNGQHAFTLDLLAPASGWTIAGVYIKSNVGGTFWYGDDLGGLYSLLYKTFPPASGKFQDNSHVTVFGQATVVPLPAALPLAASAFGLIGLLGWRRSRRTA
ncbi:hypothetical protein [Hwanghaeella sp.]|uniref:hypothetical protein n=1 Tax=Hwanghaeella sp. TaxID=2605943 RepID=UPI003CCBE74B